MLPTQKFLPDLAEITSLSSIQQAPHSAQARSLRMRLAEAHFRLVLECARSYESFTIPLSHLIKEGHLALTKAARDFNPYASLPFQAFARIQICQHLAQVVGHPECGVIPQADCNAGSEATLCRFLGATGLRRNELKMLRVSDVKAFERQVGGPTVEVQGRSGRTRMVPVLPGREEDVLAMVINRAATELIFPILPKHPDIQKFRRTYARSLYLALSPAESLPLPDRYQRDAVRRVAQALGHRRIETVVKLYLR